MEIAVRRLGAPFAGTGSNYLTLELEGRPLPDIFRFRLVPLLSVESPRGL